MDKDKEIADLKASVATLTAENTTLKGDNTKLTGDLKTANDTIVKKDELIKQKNQDIVGARKETQALKELTEKEKEEMSAAEIRIHEAALALQKDQEEFRKQQAEAQAKEVSSRRESVLKSKYGSDKNPDLAKKILENFEKIKDSDKASTPQEIEAMMETAFRMTGEPAPSNPVRQDINSGPMGDSINGGDSSPVHEANVSNLAKSMGLDISTPEQK